MSQTLASLRMEGARDMSVNGLTPVFLKRLKKADPADSEVFRACTQVTERMRALKTANPLAILLLESSRVALTQYAEDMKFVPATEWTIESDPKDVIARARMQEETCTMA